MIRALAAVFVLAACHSNTELVVRVESDLAPGAPFAAGMGTSRFSFVRFKLEMLPFGDAVDQLEPEPVFRDYVQLRTPEVPDGADLPVELGVVARGDWRDRVLGVEVRGQAAESDPDKDSERAYIYTRALAHFIDGDVVLLTVRLLGACAVAAGATPECKDHERCVLGASGSTTCETIPIDAALPHYEAPPSANR